MSTYESSSAESNRILLNPTNICNGNACTVGYERTLLCWINIVHCLYYILGYRGLAHSCTLTTVVATADAFPLDRGLGLGGNGWEWGGVGVGCGKM